MLSRTRKIRLILTLALALGLSACNLPGAADPDQVALGIAQTQIAHTQTALAAAGQAAVLTGAAPENPQTPLTPTLHPPTPTLTATITLTPTRSIPRVTVSRSTNCRTGPGEPYEIIGVLLEGEETEVVGISADGGTWIVKNPDREGECWLWGYYATVEGPTGGLRVYDPPPTPTPAFVWAGNWTTYVMVPGDPPDTFPMTVTVEEDAFTGVIEIGGGHAVNLAGTISEDGLSVSGTWASPTLDGTFAYYALGTNQFQGKGQREGITDAWCGARGGAGMPDPCLKE